MPHSARVEDRNSLRWLTDPSHGFRGEKLSEMPSGAPENQEGFRLAENTPAGVLTAISSTLP